MKRGFVALAFASLCLPSLALADARVSAHPRHAVDAAHDLVSRPPVTRGLPPRGNRPVNPSPNTVNSRVVYMNRCTGASCKVRNDGSGSDSTRSPKRSGIAGACTQQGGAGGDFVLGAYSDGDAKWGQLMSCVKRIMAPYNIQITDTNPGSAAHFEIMNGGSPEDIGCDTNTGGIAEFPGGDAYYPNAVVFDFSDVWGGRVDLQCKTAAQEIAHSWNLDHTIDVSDPMSYKFGSSSLVLSFKNKEKCGSDCVCPDGSDSCPGQTQTGPFGQTCTGTGNNGTHACVENGQSTQNEIDVITALFGPSGAKVPNLAFTAPADGATVQPGFTVSVDCTSTDSATISEVDFTIDGRTAATVTSAPFTFNASTGLLAGNHKVEALCVTSASQTADASITVTQVAAAACDDSNPCATSTDVCVDGVCQAGAGTAGGLGSTCTTNDDCSSGTCLTTDDMNYYCVVPCDMTVSGSCPDGFGCIAGPDSGVCFPGADNGGGGGGGGCNAGGGAGSILLGLGFAAFVFTRRRSA